MEFREYLTNMLAKVRNELEAYVYDDTEKSYLSRISDKDVVDEMMEDYTYRSAFNEVTRQYLKLTIQEMIVELESKDH